MVDGYFVTPADVQPVEMGKGITRRTMGVTDEAMLCEFTAKAGALVPEHSHMNDQVGYVVRGKMELYIGDQMQVVAAGDSYAIPGGVVHRAVFLEDSVIIDVFSPPREDYRTEAR